MVATAAAAAAVAKINQIHLTTATARSIEQVLDKPLFTKSKDQNM